MKYNITERDKLTLLQSDLHYRYRLYVIDRDMNVLDMVEGVQSIGEYSIDSDSDVRRTSSFILQLDESYRDTSIENKIYRWMDHSFKLEIGIYNIREDSCLWYECGYYTMASASTSYSSTTNQLSVSLADWIVKLDGARNGTIGGSPTIKIPVEDENGNKTIIKHALTAFLKLSSSLKSFIIDDIGEYYALPENNADWEQYRQDRPDWNVLPYELEFDGSATILDIIKELCNLYPNYQYFFDVYGNLCVSMIPSCENYPLTLDNDYIQQILLAESSESVDYDIARIKNVTEVFGQLYEADRMSADCSVSGNVYTITLSGYTEYKSNEYIAFTACQDNGNSMSIKIGSLEPIPLYYEDTKTTVAPGTIRKDETYVFKIRKVEGSYLAYYLGQYQPHALCVLTNNANDPYYTKQYFEEKYNCDNVILRVEEESPFAVQKIGEMLDYKQGGDFENIESDKVAMDNAIYYNKLSTTRYDTVTITTKMIPFLDVYSKVSYKKQQEDDTHEYIIKSIHNNTDSLTSAIQMYRFYPLYFV